jgi:mono/diheme cytochrome c family protein
MRRHAPAALLLAALAACGGCKKKPAGEGKKLTATTLVIAGELTPEQRAKAETSVKNNCLACHTAEMLDQQRLTPQQWAANVKKMQGWGAPLEPDEPELVTALLSEKYGLAAPTYGIAEVDAKAAEDSIAPTPDADYAGGDAARGAEVYKASCLSCHGAEAKGDRLGVNLVDRPVLYRAADFALVVTKGRNRMPETTGVQKPDIAALLAYLRTL